MCVPGQRDLGCVCMSLKIGEHVRWWAVRQISGLNTWKNDFYLGMQTYRQTEENMESSLQSEWLANTIPHL